MSLPLFLLTAATLLAPAAAAGAFQDRPSEVEEVDDFEDLDEVEEVAADSENNRGVAAVLAFFHPALVHAPIAWLMLLVLVDWLCLVGGHTTLYKPGYYLMFLALISLLPAVTTGLVRFDGLDLSGGDLETVLLHRNSAFACAGVLAIAVALRFGRPELNGARRYVYVGLVTIAAALVGLTGSLGGEMMYGPVPL